MLTCIDWSEMTATERQNRLTRPMQKRSAQNEVQAIIAAVREGGDEALRQFSREFDGVDIDSPALPAKSLVRTRRLGPGPTTNFRDETMLGQGPTYASSPGSIELAELSALKTAIRNIRAYHEATLPPAVQVDIAPGLRIERLYRPIDRVGLYVPGGNNTPLISSLLMQAIPALVAGCPLRIVCTPPNARGEIDPRLLAAARLCGIEQIFRVGGAQAIAAMAYGTESIPRVDKIFGPGNAYVTEAKNQVALDANGAAIDMPAGPSEVMILADDQANPAYVAADLLAQAEHGPDSQVLLICDSVGFANAVNQALVAQFQTLSRQAIIQQSLAGSCIIICPDRPAVLAIVNEYAPEHLIINRLDNQGWVKDIRNAGTIFLGPWAAETMGDYISGSNHVLPTNGFARSHSGLSTLDFLKAISVQSIDRVGVKQLGEAACILARMEGLDAHANAVQQRLGDI